MTLLTPNQPESPKWGSTTKTVVGLAVIAMIAALVVYFRNIVGPLLLAFIIAFLLHPLCGGLHKTFKLSWRMSVNIIYLVLILILISLIALSGFAIIQQAQSLVNSVDNFIQTLPELVRDLATRTYSLGPYTFTFSKADLESLTNQLLGTVRPLIGQAGTLLGKFAASAATSLAWVLFSLVISYFLLSESGQWRESLIYFEIPGYNADVQILIQKLSATWDAFLRGQLLISLMVIASYYLMLTMLGTRLTLVIALMAGLARFLPYIGPLITWTVTGIVAFLQVGNYFGLESVTYTILVLGCCVLLDQVYDNLVVPRVIGRTLGLHPAGVLIAALIAARLIGLIGLVLAAPVLATIMLGGRYIGRKMFDLPPWPPEQEREINPPQMPWTRFAIKLGSLWRSLKKRS